MCVVALESRCSGNVFARLVALCALVCMLLALSAVDASAKSLSITTTSLPSGQVGTAYSATLAATGGTSPYAWSLTSGTLPAGLTLNAATGAISGTPTAAANATALTFMVT
ncbi:MAG: Ig domain-containing protein, partial [Terracidiphilus sp.]